MGCTDAQDVNPSLRVYNKPMTPQSKDPVIYQSKPGLERIPYEIMSLIIKDLDLEDIFVLSLISRHFQYLVKEERFCQTTLGVSSSPIPTIYICPTLS